MAGTVEGVVVHPGRPLLLLGLTLLLVAHTVEAQADPLADRLYFTLDDREGSVQTFTTLAPDPNATAQRVQFLQIQDRSRTVWALPYLAADWTPQAGEGTAALYLSGLDEILPVPPTDDPSSSLGAPAEVRVVVLVQNGTGERLIASGETSYVPDPTRADRPPRLLEFDLNMEGGGPLEGGDNETSDALIVTILLHGRHPTNVSPVHLHVDGPDAPSALHIPGFPYEAQYAHDLALKKELDCLQAILEKRSCDTPDPQPDEEREQGATPLPGLLALLSLLLVAALHERER